jgi:hypothetical protein
VALVCDECGEGYRLVNQGSTRAKCGKRASMTCLVAAALPGAWQLLLQWHAEMRCTVCRCTAAADTMSQGLVTLPVLGGANKAGINV